MQIAYKGYNLICSNADQIVSVRKPDGWVFCTAKDFDEAKVQVDWIIGGGGQLTQTQIEGLRRLRDRGSLQWCSGRGRAGGAVARMFERLGKQRLCTVRPYEITDLGRVALDYIEQKTATKKAA